MLHRTRGIPALSGQQMKPRETGGEFNAPINVAQTYCKYILLSFKRFLDHLFTLCVTYDRAVQIIIQVVSRQVKGLPDNMWCH